MEIRFKPRTALIIYGILAAGLVGILVAWQLVPKQADSIVVYGLDGKPCGTYRIKDPGDTLRYAMDDEKLQVYWKGRIDIYPMSNVRTIELRK